MTTKQQSGFGAVPIIAIIAVVVLIGFVGVKLLNAQSNKTGANSIANNQTNPANAQTSNTQTSSTPATPAQTDEYLHIKELGIKLKLSDGIKDALYSFDNSNAEYPRVRLSTQSLVNKSNGMCDPKVSNPLGSIMSTKNKNQPQGGTWQANGVNVFEIGSNYVIYNSPTSSCSTDAAVSNLETSQLQAIKESFKTVQLDN